MDNARFDDDDDGKSKGCKKCVDFYADYHIYIENSSNYFFNPF